MKRYRKRVRRGKARCCSTPDEIDRTWPRRDLTYGLLSVSDYSPLEGLAHTLGWATNGVEATIPTHPLQDVPNGKLRCCSAMANSEHRPHMEHAWGA